MHGRLHVRDCGPGVGAPAGVVPASPAPILLLGAGRMGGALVAGWRRARAFSPGELMVRDPYAGGEALAAAEAGARLNPADGDLAAANTVILAVKPQAWLQAAEAAAPHLRRARSSSRSWPGSRPKRSAPHSAAGT